MIQMKKQLLFLLVAIVVSFHLQAQFTYTQVISGLTDTYESGRSLFALGDIDNDGDIDIISVGDHWGGVVPNQMGIMVFKNNGTGTHWTKTMSGVHGYGGVALGDVNNDGYLDVAYGVHHAYGTTDFGDQFLEVVLGDGTGLNWIPWDDGLALQGQDWGMFGCDLADINNNGLLDLGANSFGCCDGVWVYVNNGNGTWTPVVGVLNPTDNSSEQFRFGDFNRDGYVDFIANNTQVNNQAHQIWKNNGNTTFSPMSTGSPFTGAWGDFQFQMDVLDVNNDGADDIAITLDNYARVYTYSNTTNSWQNYSNGLGFQNVSRLALGDLDNDGHADLVTYRNGMITFYRGCAGNWIEAGTLPVPETTGYDIKLADLDHNGYLDIIYWAVYNGTNMLRVYLQTTPATTLSITPISPKGGECYKPGSVQKIKWISSVPLPASATVDIDFSSTGPTGPFTNVVTNAPNSGTYQWQIPAVSSINCYLKFTIDNGTTTFVTTTPAAFCIDTCYVTPIIPGPVAGPVNVCAGSTATYTVPATPNATSYVWTLPSGWVGSSTTNTINATVGTGVGFVVAVAQTPSGPSQPQSLIVYGVTIDTTVTQTGTTLTASATGASYQWMNCGTGTIISGAMSQSYTPAVTGAYAVIITQFGCTDTSGCHNVTISNINDFTANQSLTVTPNPTNGLLKINYSEVMDQIVIFNMLGEIVYSAEPGQYETVVDMSAFPDGLYLVFANTPNGILRKTVVKFK